MLANNQWPLSNPWFVVEVRPYITKVTGRHNSSNFVIFLHTI